MEQAISTSVPAYVPSVDLPLTSEVKRKPAMGRTPKHTEEVLPGEVRRDSTWVLSFQGTPVSACFCIFPRFGIIWGSNCLVDLAHFHLSLMYTEQ